MNKLEALGDSVETHQDGFHSLLNSFQFKAGLNSSRVEKCDQSTSTDKMLCNCDCDLIPKLKEKAHKSFMQVIQIEALYKEEIQELKSFYEESIKNNDKKFKIKEDLIHEKCKELESEIEKMREHYEKIKSEEVGNILENPFDLSNFSNFDISQCFPPDDSCESILNIREFIKMPKLKENASELNRDFNSAMVKVKESVKLFDQDESDVNRELLHLEEGVAKIFMFLNEMIENAVNAHEKYNDLVATSTETENKYSKLYNLFEASQKESKFMAEHIKRISHDKIKMEKKSIELERINKTLEESVELLKKTLVETTHTHQRNRLNLNKDEEIFQSYKLLDDEEEANNSKNHLFLSLKNKKLMTKSAQGSTMEKMLPKSLNFKKKEKFEKSKE